MSTSKLEKVALVHADQVGAHVDRPLELGLVVHLHERIQAQLTGDGMEVDELVVVQGRHDEEDGVGSHDPRSHHVPGVDGEVLPEDGEVDGLACRPQVVGGPAEPPLVGEHREARGSPARVGHRQVGRIELHRQISLGG